MMFRNVALATMLAAMVGTPPLGSAVAQDYRWDLANEYAASSLPGEGDQLFVQITEEKSNGQIKITPHFGGSIGFGSEEHFQMVQLGAIQLANTPIHFHGGVDPLLEIGSLPFVASTPERARILYEVTKPYYDEVLREHNQVRLAVTPWPPSGLWATKPITTVDDLKGWKLRVYDVNGQLTLKEAGANPVRLGWADIVPALSTGAISGILTSAEGGVNSEFWQYLDYFTEINYATPLSMIHMNLDVWNSLSEDLQQILREAGEAVTERSFAALEERRQQNYQTMRENGMTVITDPDPELLKHLEQSARPALERWLERIGPEGSRILAKFRERLPS